MAPLDRTSDHRISLERALRELRGHLASDASAPDWRWQSRRLLSGVRDALTPASAPYDDAWLAARQGSSHRSRRQLQARVAVLSAGVLDRLDTDTVLTELRRLQTDLEHHVQRLHDLVYDSVALELGGSE